MTRTEELICMIKHGNSNCYDQLTSARKCARKNCVWSPGGFTSVREVQQLPDHCYKCGRYYNVEKYL